ncbi:BRCT domain-containing protein [Acinetobacter seifertii]|uniref:BRCT domain-containing protein n=1 Tax=Acinetobacter seifertii TaxID=1530123 RepID=UPI00124DED30|nr:BRCT domain-containing protein [Acinetobacter seifertii]
MELNEQQLEKYMEQAINDKEINVFLGFIEGLILDESIQTKEVEALQHWMESKPQVYCNYPFDFIVQSLTSILDKDGNVVSENKTIFLQVLKIFLSKKFYKKNTSDIQRLHGLIAGVVCDQTINKTELENLNQWMKDHDYLEEDIFFQELYALLRPVRTKADISDQDTLKILSQIKKYVDIEKFGVLKSIVESEGNPDFYKGQLTLSKALYCFTGASSRFKKNDWKDLVKNNGAEFTDDMTTSVNYLVICNKGNKAWAHVSYGRKFEQAKKWQNQGHDIKIITEDDFVKAIGLSESD